MPTIDCRRNRHTRGGMGPIALAAQGLRGAGARSHGACRPARTCPVAAVKGAVLGANPRIGRLAVAAAVAVLLLGITQLGSARTDFLPEFMPPSVQVQTEALGLAAAEVEQLITVPLEQDLLNGVPGSTASTPGHSRALGHRHRLRARHRHLRGAADGPGAADPGARAAQRREPGDHGRAPRLGEPGRHDRAHVQECVPHRHVSSRALEDPPQAHGHPRSRERGDLG